MRANRSDDKLGHVGDGLARLDRDAEDVGAVALDALGDVAHRRRHRLDAPRIEIGPHRARADHVVALGREPALDRACRSDWCSANTIQLGLVPGVAAATDMRPVMPSAPGAVSTCRLSPRALVELAERR